LLWRGGIVAAALSLASPGCELSAGKQLSGTDHDT